MTKNNGTVEITQLAFSGFDSCLAEETAAVVLVAISGGSDSMALLLLANRYFKERFPDCRLHAVTVDHQLRAESAQEAAGVAVFCQQLGIRHQTLRWEGNKPASGMAAAAREARYDLLVQAARDSGARIILTGHTADDQVETYLMRAQRVVKNGDVPSAKSSAKFSEGRGLAVMADQTLLQDSILLCRPLLKVWREDLRNILRGFAIAWVDDPSNENLAYERPRMRQFAKQADKPAVLEAVNQAALCRRHNNHRVALMLRNDDCPIRLLTGDQLFLPQGWDCSFTDVAPLALGYLLAAVGGKSLLPSIRDCAALMQQLHSVPTNGRQRMTLHHCVIESTAQGLKIWRERRNLPVVAIQAGESVLWDGRYCVMNEADFPINVAAVNAQQLSGYLRLHHIETAQLHLDSLLSSPAIFRHGEVAELPAQMPILSEVMQQNLPVAIKRSFACFDRVLSGYDFDVAKAVKALLTMPLNHKCH